MSGTAAMRRASGPFPPLAGGTSPAGASLNPVLDRPSLSRFDADMPHARPANTVAEVAQRFHREGLPIARLWEGHRALVCLGLNPRGKPGLWLVQKTH